jgi:hypothetical protein
MFQPSSARRIEADHPKEIEHSQKLHYAFQKDLRRGIGFLPTPLVPRIRTLYQSQKMTVAAMQMAEKKVWRNGRIAWRSGASP